MGQQLLLRKKTKSLLSTFSTGPVNRSSLGPLGQTTRTHQTTHHVLEKYTTNPPFDAGAIYVDGTLRQHEREKIDKTMGVSLFVAQEKTWHKSAELGIPLACQSPASLYMASLYM